METRLGLDMGTNSIGWCLYNGETIRDMGVRIFSDGRDAKTGASLAVDRRAARAMRRRRDRYLGRRDALLRALIAVGLMPEDKAEAKKVAALDPYPLRAKGVTEKLSPYEFGRALFHLNQRRGFKSNRKTDRDPNEGGKIAGGAKALDEAMDGRTYGQFLHDNEIKRVRMRPEGDGYDFYPDREHLKAEFAWLWCGQSKHYPELLTEEVRARLHRIIFFQRDLKPPVVGYCTFYNQEPNQEKRLPKSSLLFQELRLYQEANNLRITKAGAESRPLEFDQREAVIHKLKSAKTVSFSALATLLKLQDGEGFSKDTPNCKGLDGDEISFLFNKKECFNKRWAHFDAGTRETIIERVENEIDPETLYVWLMNTHGVSREQAIAIDKIRNRLPQGHGRLGETASRLVLAKLKEKVITYDKAVLEALDRSHSDERTGEDLKSLPYYGEILSRHISPGKPEFGDANEARWGKITNPTVHIGLNQLTKLVNEIIKKYGRPDEMVVELARDLKLNEKQKADINREQAANIKAAEARSKKLISINQLDTGANRMLLRIWDELSPGNVFDHCCPFCGKPIGVTMLFNGEAEVEHIIPYSISYDDSVANKVISHRSCNRDKGNKTPWGRWGGDPDKWAIIADQVGRLDKRKRWRFEPDAEERFKDHGGFIARQLTDTQYLARMALRYLSSLYPERPSDRLPGDGVKGVYVIPGRMTAMLRRRWGLNDLLPDHNRVDNRHSNAPKNRLDHRHHAIDAAVIGVTTRGLLNMISKAAGRAESQELDKLFDGLEMPWASFRDDLRAGLERIVISHKADHGRDGAPLKSRDVTTGRLHQDRAYGLTGDVNASGDPVVVHTIPFLNLKPIDVMTEGRIRDKALQAELYDLTEGLTDKAFEAALREFSKKGSRRLDKNGNPVFQKIRHVRVLGEKAGSPTLNVIPIYDENGKAFKGYKGGSNASFIVWRLPDGKWVHNVVPTFNAHQPDYVELKPHPAAKKMLCLRQNDMIAVERNGDPREIMRVIKFAQNGQITITHHIEAGDYDKRKKDAGDPIEITSPTAGGLKKMKARQIRINPLGHILDPGPRSG
jgi:CRISPR-associated endonuclease Csn1